MTSMIEWEKLFIWEIKLCIFGGTMMNGNKLPKKSGFVGHLYCKRNTFSIEDKPIFNIFSQIGPEKGAVQLATAAVLNAVWDLWAKKERKVLFIVLSFFRCP